MRSNYKRLGQYIQEVDERNKADIKDDLLGVSVSKVFIESIANTVGTDFTKYKIVKRNQFTYIPDTSRRGDKIGVALLEDKETGLVSQAYTVFEIVDTTKLLPQYLMMWFKRPEFDRYARFISHGSVREIFGWDDMCNIDLPVPSIEKQHEIVEEYNVLVNRIDLNNKLIEKLEETAQAIYKHWFVDFEFPDEDGRPYKSSGGEMEHCEELCLDIPTGWRWCSFGEIIQVTSGKTPFDRNDRKNAVYKYPIYGAGDIIGFSSKYLFDEKVLSIGRVGTHGVVNRVVTPSWTTDNTLVLMSTYYEYTNQILNHLNYDELNRGGVQGLITQKDILNTSIIIPTQPTLDAFEDVASSLLNHHDNLALENEKTERLTEIMMSRIAIQEG